MLKGYILTIMFNRTVIQAVSYNQTPKIGTINQLQKHCTSIKHYNHNGRKAAKTSLFYDF